MRSPWSEMFQVRMLIFFAGLGAADMSRREAIGAGRRSLEDSSCDKS